MWEISHGRIGVGWSWWNGARSRDGRVDHGRNMGIIGPVPCDRLGDGRGCWSWVNSSSPSANGSGSWHQESCCWISSGSNNLRRGGSNGRMRYLGDVECDCWCHSHCRLWTNIELEISLIREWVSIQVVAKNKQGIIATCQLVLIDRTMQISTRLLEMKLFVSYTS